MEKESFTDFKSYIPFLLLYLTEVVIVVMMTVTQPLQSVDPSLVLRWSQTRSQRARVMARTQARQPPGVSLFLSE